MNPTQYAIIKPEGVQTAQKLAAMNQESQCAMKGLGCAPAARPMTIVRNRSHYVIQTQENAKAAESTTSVWNRSRSATQGLDGALAARKTKIVNSILMNPTHYAIQRLEGVQAAKKLAVRNPRRTAMKGRASALAARPMKIVKTANLWNPPKCLPFPKCALKTYATRTQEGAGAAKMTMSVRNPRQTAI